MIKSLFLKYWDGLIGILHHKSAFPTAFMVCATFWVCVFAVDLPSKNKTMFENWLDGRWENWRLHSDTGKTFIADKKWDTLERECADLERILEKLRITRWQLMAIAKGNTEIKIEIEKIAVTIGTKTKKLEAAQYARAAALHTYNELVASR